MWGGDPSCAVPQNRKQPACAQQLELVGQSRFSVILPLQVTATFNANIRPYSTPSTLGQNPRIYHSVRRLRVLLLPMTGCWY